jgi:hypothetical protein
MDKRNPKKLENYREELSQTAYRLSLVASRKAFLKERIAAIQDTIEKSFLRISKTQEWIEEVRDSFDPKRPC